MDLPRFREEDYKYWTRRVGPWFDPAGPAGHHLITGRVLDLTMSVGLYVGVEDPDTALYIGKVCRHDAGVSVRIMQHDQMIEAWDAVWLIPLKASTADFLVREFETGMIKRHRPLHNVRQR